jgi:hypothetical protein
MAERSRRYRLRHVLYKSLSDNLDKTWSFEKLTEAVMDKAVELGILQEKSFNYEDNLTKVKWFLLEEFASTGQRRNSLESLALAEVVMDGIAYKDISPFYEKWSRAFEIEPFELEDTVRLILDYYRRRGILSDPLMRRRWTSRDAEVRKGLIC